MAGYCKEISKMSPEFWEEISKMSPEFFEEEFEVG